MEQKKNAHACLTRRDLLKCGLYCGVASALVPGFCASGCSKVPGAKRPNVLMISIDTLRKDHCSAYGYERDTTPNLRLLAEEGARFDLAYAPSSSTAPSHATMFTSLYPLAHQVLKQGQTLAQGDYTLAEHLTANGYETAAVVASFVMNEKFGFAQGFTFYDDDFKASTATIHRRYWKGQPDVIDQDAVETTRKAIHWLKKKRSGQNPFFLFVHYFDPHAPYVPPEPFASQFAPPGRQPAELDQITGRYDGEIAFTDREIGRLFEALKETGLEENTLVLVTSDHGEGLGQHDHLGHSINIYEEAVRVPLLFRWPDRIAKGCVFTAPVEQVDLAPTMLDLIGVKADGFSFQGRSLAAALRGDDDASLDGDRPVYLYREYYENRPMKLYSGRQVLLKGGKSGIRVGKWKYIEGKEEKTRELFDLEADPQEQINLTSTHSQKAGELASQLEAWEDVHRRKESLKDTISEKDLERLKALGYVL
jgi:arylsulfatase A-like enzyme